MLSRLKKHAGRRKGIKKPVICPQSDHNITVRRLDPDAVKVLRRLNKYGHTAYLVGGSVRDLLLDRKPKDFDVSTSAHPNAIRKLFRNSFLVGRRFRLAHIKFRDNIIETSTFRKPPEQTTKNSEEDTLYHHRDNTFGTPGEDALRRDFTVNALFYDIGTHSVIDHTGGLTDLKNGIIRCIGDPNIRFCEDPVRMMRAARFASRLNFAIEKKTWRAMKKHCDKISDATKPRLLEEILRLFAFGSSEQNFRTLYEAGMLRILLPDLHKFLKTPSAGLLWKHLAAFDKWSIKCEQPPGQDLMMATLMYTPFLTMVEKEEKKGHRVIHSDIARKLLKRFAADYHFPNRSFYRFVHIIENQQRFIPSRRKFSKARFAAQETFHPSLDLREIHLMATGENLKSLKEWQEIAPKRPTQESARKRRKPSKRRYHRRRPPTDRNQKPRPRKDAQ